MNTGRRRPWAAAIAIVLVVGGCSSGDGGEGSGPSPSQSGAGVPTAEQLASMLLTEQDLTGEWEVTVPSDPSAAIDGAVSAEQQDKLPRLDLCDQASDGAREAAEALRWQAFRHMDMAPEDPLDPRAGDMTGHMIFTQEMLLGGDPAEIEAAFDLIRQGMQDCATGEQESDDGHSVRSEPLEIPAIGDDRIGGLTLVEEPGDGGTWSLSNALMRDGSVLMWLSVTEIIAGEGLQPELSKADVDTILTTAADKVG